MFDSLSPLGSLITIDSFEHYGSLDLDDSLSYYGPLCKIDSLAYFGSLGNIDSLMSFGSLRAGGSLSSVRPHALVGVVEDGDGVGFRGGVAVLDAVPRRVQVTEELLDSITPGPGVDVPR